MTVSLFVGIDVSKGRLDVALRPEGEGWRADNDAAGIAALVARLDALGPSLIVAEATGGYERPVLAPVAIRCIALLTVVMPLGGSRGAVLPAPGWPR